MDARSSRPEAESRYIHAASASPTPIPQRLPRMVSRASTEARRRASTVATLWLLAVTFGGVGYALGAYSYPRGLWPISLVREILEPRPAGRQDELGRQVSFPGKVAIPCPRQTARTAVLLALGQSNIGNHGAASFATRHPANVVNYFAGRCYAAASPLLGSTGQGGEYLTPLADRLVESGSFDDVVLIPAAVGATNIQRWKDGGDVLDAVLRELPATLRRFRITAVLWHQGESDVPLRTSARNYAESFASMVAALGRAGVRAPVYVAVASKCGLVDEWNPRNPVAMAQRRLIDGKAVRLGVDADALLDPADRAADGCHLSARGQLRTASAFASAIVRYQQRDQAASVRR